MLIAVDVSQYRQRAHFVKYPRRPFIELADVIALQGILVLRGTQATSHAQILIDLGLRDIRVLTNHPKKVVALEGYGIRIADQVPLRVDKRKPTHQML